jgi:multiple sugar transport system permease protein
MAWNRKQTRRVATGLAFLAPNIAGFLLFTLVPLVISLVMAFTNWDIRLHNMFRNQPLRFVGFENFSRLFAEPDFLKYLGNTLFLMMGIPFGVAGSLTAAVLLSKDLRGRKRCVRGLVFALLGLVLGLGLLTIFGLGASSLVILLGGVAGLILVGGALGGRTVYRTLFYFPHFTAGVATFILWKKLYNPHTGPINGALRPVLQQVGGWVNGVPAPVVQSGLWICAAAMGSLAFYGGRRLRSMFRDGDVGLVSMLFAGVLLVVPGVLALRWMPTSAAACVAIAGAAVCIVWIAFSFGGDRDFRGAPMTGFGTAAMLGGGLLICQLILLGIGNVLYHLPAMSASGLDGPEWLARYEWAKPSLMIMGLWAAIGSNNMLLYLAGLSNIPQELYEAADIDGATGWVRFWHVTWPQLAPVTFFVLVMSVIGGLQGGFEMARVMTQGGPAGSTTTLSYYVYIEGFESGRLGYASAVAWTLFLLVFAVTLFNWRFGNRYVQQ